ncbi:uncharacterized protein OCT59_008982 [Rhizophagus irregularis]|uniref:uncharacterized protein n=1 Tax=Rhizophagus irregularis TaxID=588596 RepID=UPI003327EE54|nr:hypothetical protein OCT59_008982 [Rhizophagus irregularis]
MTFHLLTKLSRDLVQLFDTSAYYDFRLLNDKIILSNENISPSTFEIILKYIYSGKIDLLNCNGNQSFDLLFAAEELKLTELLEYIQENLIQQQIDWMDQNFIHEKIFNYESLKKLNLKFIIFQKFQIILY